MNEKYSIYSIFLFIIFDIFGVFNLWGENIYRRILHHLQNGEYNNRKTPWITFPNTNLLPDEINDIQHISKTTKVNCLNNIDKTLSSSLAGNYSTKCTLYYDDFNKKDQETLDTIGNRLKRDFEQIIGKPLSLGESNFRCTILKYEGLDSGFNFHYDTEESNCYRCLFLFDKQGNISPFSYYDEKGNIIDKDIPVGEGIFFQGTKTYHGVKPNKDPNSKRYVIGWQYSTDLSFQTKTLCSELRSANVTEMFILLLPYIILMNLSIFLFNNIITKYKLIPTGLSNYILRFTLITIILATFLPNKLPKQIGTGLNTSFFNLLLYMLLCIASSLTSYVHGLVLFNYILLTEMFTPSFIISKSLVHIGH